MAKANVKIVKCYDEKHERNHSLAMLEHCKRVKSCWAGRMLHRSSSKRWREERFRVKGSVPILGQPLARRVRNDEGRYSTKVKQSLRLPIACDVRPRQPEMFKEMSVLGTCFSPVSVILVCCNSRIRIVGGIISR